MEPPTFPVIVADALLEHLQGTHNLVKVTPFEKQRMAYSLVLPNGWVTEENLGQQPDDIGRLVRIGLFASKVGPDATVVQVFFTHMPFEVGLRDWVQVQAEAFGTRLVHCQYFRFASGSVVDSGGFYGTGASQHIVRIVAHADDARILMVSAMAPAALYQERQDNIAIATNSIKFLYPSGSTLLEQWLEAGAEEPSFRVAHPASWMSRVVPKRVPSKSGVDLFLPKGSQIMAYVRVKAIIPENSMADQDVRLAEEELRESSVTITSAWAEDNDPSIGRVIGVLRAVHGAGILAGSPVELRLGFVKRGSLLFAVTLISVRKQDDTFLWMRSKRVYEMALATAEPQKVSIQ
jgi:hypothetical protein